MKKLRIILYALAFLGLLLSFLFMKPLFVLLLACLLVYIVYRSYSWVRPCSDSKNIRHGLLKGNLVSRYGPEEGNKIYTQLVENLKKKGYR